MDDLLIIQVENHTKNSVAYYSIDHFSGFPAFTSFIGNAKKMPLKEVETVMAGFLLPNKTNGLPNLLAMLAGDFGRGATMADLEITIGEIAFKPATKYAVLRHTYFNRSDEVAAETAKIAAEAKSKLTQAELDALGIR